MTKREEIFATKMSIGPFSVTLPPSQGFSREQLAEAFELVQNENSWKDPIDALVPSEIKDLLVEAIIHYTGSFKVVVEQWDKDTIRIQAPGYYLSGLEDGRVYTDWEPNP